jgi:nucleotide-binding universal stress UspA family protein
VASIRVFGPLCRGTSRSSLEALTRRAQKKRGAVMKVNSAIVLAINDDRREEGAVGFAAAEARLTGRPVTVVHVVHGSAHVAAHNPLLYSYEEVEARGRQLVTRVTDELSELTGGSVEVHGETVRGRTVDRLVQMSRNAHLVVVQRPEDHRVAPLALGSTSSGLAARSLAPVVCVPASWTRADPFVRRVTLGASERDAAWSLLGHGFRLAAEHHAGLHVVRAVDLPELDVAGGVDLLSRRRDGVRADLERELRPFRNRFPGVDVDIELVDGPATEVLTRATDRSGLLVLGRRDEPHPAYERLGPVTRSMLRSAKCPVLVVPRPFGESWEEATCSASASTAAVDKAP